MMIAALLWMAGVPSAHRLVARRQPAHRAVAIKRNSGSLVCGDGVLVFTPEGHQVLNDFKGYLLPTELSPCWTPDGGHIIFQNAPYNGQASTYVMDPDGSHRHMLLNFAADQMALSPNGTQIAYQNMYYSTEQTDQERSAIAILYLKTGVHYDLTTFYHLNANPDWSPDGNKIAYSLWIGEASKIMIMNSDGTGKHLLPNQRPNFYYDNPSWSPDGKMLAYWWDDGSNGQIRIVNLADGKTHIAAMDAQQCTVAWSPHETHIAFSRYTPHTKGGYASIVNLKTGRVRTVNRSDIVYNRFSWSRCNIAHSYKRK